MITTWEQWQRWHNENSDQQYTVFPYIKEKSLQLEGERSVVSWEDIWEDASPYAFVLESGKSGRFTYLGLHPVEVIQGTGLEAVTFSFGAQQSGAQREVDQATIRRLQGKPLDLVREWMSLYRSPQLEKGPKWTGGCAGFWGYDTARTIERLPELAQADLQDVPDFMFMRMNQLWAIDHQENKVFCAVQASVDGVTDSEELHRIYLQAAEQADEMERFWHNRFESAQIRSEQKAKREERIRLQELSALISDAKEKQEIHTPFGKEAYMSAVQAIQSYIGSGDVFQVNLSLRQSKQAAATPEKLYEWLRIVNPSPYMGFLRSPSFQLVSASPELLVEMYNGRLAARPIAGTRRRGYTSEEDARLVEELTSNEKEKAEHVMLVDLERNDLGRVAAYGSVKVSEFMVVEHYSHVMHLVSQVEGDLAEHRDAYDVIAAKFPGGTITGAPKVRTMEIIEELEPVRRGPYTGSMGWIDCNGNMEFNIIIRTMVMQQEQVYVQAGAGIVIDSDPEREYCESLNKAKALWKAIQLSENELARTDMGRGVEQ